MSEMLAVVVVVVVVVVVAAVAAAAAVLKQQHEQRWFWLGESCWSLTSAPKTNLQNRANRPHLTSLNSSVVM